MSDNEDAVSSDVKDIGESKADEQAGLTSGSAERTSTGLEGPSTGVEGGPDNVQYQFTEDGAEEDVEEEEEEMVVLDPEHPLMIRMQDALTKYLTKQLDKLSLEMKEKGQELKKMTTDREELGVNLYGIQQQLAKQQMLLENEHDTHSGSREKRAQAEELAKQVEQLHSATEADLKLHLEKDEKLRADVEALDNTLFYLTQLEKNLHNDIRTITHLSIDLVSEDATNSALSLYSLTILGHAFLWHQIRNMVSVLLRIGLGLESPQVISGMLSSTVKYNYGMASDLPLVLFECEFENVDWNASKVDLSKLWFEFAVKSTLIKQLMCEDTLTVKNVGVLCDTKRQSIMSRPFIS